MLDAVFYVTDNGIKWRAMPTDFPVWDRVYAFFRRRHRKGPGRGGTARAASRKSSHRAGARP
ncbi:transposase [Streptomyces sp. NPDC002853]